MKCQVCEQNTALLYCQGCGVLLCAECCYLDLFGHGCGCVVPLYMCHKCINDPSLNPYTTCDMSSKLSGFLH
jgi:hypothetical protein